MLAGLLLGGQAAAQPREVRVGVYANEPKIYVDARGEPAGILIDLLREIAREAQWTLRFVPCDWNDCLTALAAGQIDLMPDVAFTAERDRRFDFHQTPALHSWSQVYRHRDVPINALRDLGGLRVAVLRGSIQAGAFAELTTSFGITPQILLVDSLAEAFGLVREKRADAAIANHFYGTLHAPRSDMVETAIVFQPSRLFYATAKNRNADLLRAIDQRLLAWRDQPQSPYLAIMKRWAAPLPETVVPRSFWWGFGGVIGLLVLMLAAALLLQRQVALRTRHLLQANAEISRFKFIFDHASFAAWIASMEGVIVYANARCAELHGVTVAELVGRRFDTLYALRHQIEALDYWREVREGQGGEARELWHVAADGREFPMLANGLLLRDDSGRPLSQACTAVDISDRKQAEARIHQLAYYDALTGLPNRRLLVDQLQQALAHCVRRGVRGGLLFIDLDHFKTINDTLGHDVGDRLLHEVATRIRLHLRIGDTVARLGGDEFVVLVEELSEVPEIAASQIEGVGQKIMAALNRPYHLAGTEQYSTPSIGVTLFGSEPVTVDELLKQADLAMYQAKAAGRNNLRFFDPQMQTVVNARAALQSDLRRALEAGQFFIQIQPQVDQSARMIGGEALLRWQHPQRGLVSPAEFIPVAEDSGLIHELGHWVLHEACRQLVDWAARPALRALGLAVNVSVQQFRHPDFVPRVLEVLAQTGANAHRLKLEITESLLMVDLEDVVAKMTTLRSHGIGFSLDDFGTGYSSLTYLKRLPLEQLKIDASFVRDVLTDPNDAVIVRTIIALSRSLGLVAVAEGVETGDQRAVLVAEGCTAFQGYLFSRPLLPADFVHFASQGGQPAAALE